MTTRDYTYYHLKDVFLHEYLPLWLKIWMLTTQRSSRKQRLKTI